MIRFNIESAEAVGALIGAYTNLFNEHPVGPDGRPVRLGKFSVPHTEPAPAPEPEPVVDAEFEEVQKEEELEERSLVQRALFWLRSFRS